jgi:hypothetical protein
MYAEARERTIATQSTNKSLPHKAPSVSGSSPDR